MNTFDEFKKQVRSLCKPSDFNENHKELGKVRVYSYETFILLLQLGGEIIPSERVASEIFKLSIKTNMTENELVQLSSEFRLLNGILDEQQY